MAKSKLRKKKKPKRKIKRQLSEAEKLLEDRIKFFNKRNKFGRRSGGKSPKWPTG